MFELCQNAHLVLLSRRVSIKCKGRTHCDDTALPTGACRWQQPIRLDIIVGSLQPKAIRAGRHVINCHA
jgi:hypothetical protein